MSIENVRPNLKFEVNFEDDPLQAHPAYMESLTAPLAWWRLNDLSGTTAEDSSGNGRDAFYFGTPSSSYILASGSHPFYAYGDLNMAVWMSGSTGYIANADSVWQGLTSAWTIMGWIYPTATRDTSTTSYAGIFGQVLDHTVNHSFFMHYGDGSAYSGGMNTNLIPTADQIWCGWLSGGIYVFVTSPSSVSLNTWTHVACTWDGDILTMYINGSAVSTYNAAGTPSASSSAADLRIGHRSQDPVGSTHYFPGYLSDMAIFNYALRADQILALQSYHTVRPIDEDNYVDLSASVDLNASRVRSSPVRRGRSDSVSRVEAGTGTIVLGNRDGTLSPDPVVNLLVNPSYEIYEAGLPFSIVGGATPGHHTFALAFGTRSLQLAGAGPSGSVAYATTERDGLVGMRPGKTYTFSAYLYFASSGTPALTDAWLEIVDEVAGSADVEAGSASIGALDSAYRLTVTKTIRDDADKAYCRVAWNDPDSGKYLYVDAVQLEEVTLNSAENLVVNGSFETGTHSGWIPAGSPLVDNGGTAQHGTYRAYSNGTGAVGLASNYIKVDASMPYILSAYFAQWQGALDPDSLLYLQCFDEDYALLGSVYPNEAVTGATHNAGPIDPTGSLIRYGGRYNGQAGVHGTATGGFMAGTVYVCVNAYPQYTATSFGAAQGVIVDAIQFHQGSEAITYVDNPGLTDYCDGDQADCSWGGEPHRSLSHRKQDDAPARKVGMPMRRFRLTAEWDSVEYGLLHGYVERWDWAFPSQGKDAYVTARLVDGTRILASRSMRGFARSSERAGDRIRAILAHAGISEDDIDVDDSFITTTALRAQSTVADDSSALSLIRAIEETERGVFFVSKDGLFTYQGSLYRSIEGVEDLIITDTTDDTDQARYSDISISTDIAGIVNDENIENVQSGSDFRRLYALSQQRYFPVAGSESSLWQTNTVSYLDRSFPLPFAEGIEVRPYRDPDNLWPAILGVELGALVRVERTHQGIDLAAGELHFLEGIEHDITPGNWTTRLRTAPTPRAPISADPWQTPIAKPIYLTNVFSASGGSTVVIPSRVWTVGKFYCVFCMLWAVGGTAPVAPAFSGTHTWTSIRGDTGISTSSWRHQTFGMSPAGTTTEAVTLSFAGQTPNSIYDVVLIEVAEGFGNWSDSNQSTTVSAYAGYVDVGTLTDAESIILAGVWKNANADTNWSGGVELYDRASNNMSYSVAYGFPPGVDRIDFSWGQANGFHGTGFELEAS